METTEISKKIGILVFCAAPAIIGGGISYSLFGGYPAVVVFEIILGFFALGFISD
ncbi:MAG: hypothetical protein HQK76_04400 [Desulfobacterales bacterium]|nr:hypothetical protein [Desulfobacterales bacterium]